MKKLRNLQNDPVGVFVTGEYGEQTKRPHWHAILFNFRPDDLKHKYTSDRGDKVYTSETLTKLWTNGNSELGSVTFESAGYCARYAAKKLVHGHDQNHEFHPISRKSNKHAIGKKWLEQNWRDVFNRGELILLKPDGSSARSSIPRYYEKWFKENQPQEWLAYVTQAKLRKSERAQFIADKEKNDWLKNRAERRDRYSLSPEPLTANQRRQKILESKFKQLQDHLKL